MESSTSKALVICGPTSSGKTSLALKIASLLPSANILSVDSRQVYKNLDILTGKDIPKDLSPNINIYGIDLIKASEGSNLADFTKYAKEVMEKSINSKTPLIIVGGTGLYLKSITENLTNVFVKRNEVLRSNLERKSLIELQEELKLINHEKFSSLNNSDVNNPRRLIRHIEIASNDSKDLDIQPQTNIDFRWIGIKFDKDSLQEKILERISSRIAMGVFEEVEAFIKKYPDIKLPIFSSLGLTQISDYLQHKISLEELKTSWMMKEVDYARRQMVWFSKQKQIIWYDKNSIDNQFIKELANFIKI